MEFRGAMRFRHLGVAVSNLEVAMEVSVQFLPSVQSVSSRKKMVVSNTLVDGIPNLCKSRSLGGQTCAQVRLCCMQQRKLLNVCRRGVHIHDVGSELDKSRVIDSSFFEIFVVFGMVKDRPNSFVEEK